METLWGSLELLGKYGMCLQLEVEHQEQLPALDKVFSHYPNWPLSGPVPKLPDWV